jgi:GTP-binding protein
LVAIVGAPNVGKSTLFNRLLGRRHALVTDAPGVTRDRQYGEAHDVERPFRVVDTGGLSGDHAVPFAAEIERQAAAAMDEAAAVLFVVDARAGATAVDLDLAALLRRRGGAPVLLVANKIDHEALEVIAHELHALGLGAPWPVSAEHGRGIEELIEAIEALFPTGDDDASPVGADEAELRVAIVGRPNVGKSSILNRLVGAERVIVSEVPGTTRDAIDIALQIEGRVFRLIDTAGIRRAGRVGKEIEGLAVIRARRSIEQAHVAILVVDATVPLAAQDAHIAGHVQDAGRPLLIAVNKWDLVTDREDAVKAWEERLRRRLRFAAHAPIVFVSAHSGQRVARLLEVAAALHDAAGRRIGTPELNRWLQGQIEGQREAPPPSGSLRLYYATQTGVHPPRFLIFCNDPLLVHFSLRRRIENRLREDFELGAVPVRLDFRARRAPRER